MTTNFLVLVKTGYAGEVLERIPCASELEMRETFTAKLQEAKAAGFDMRLNGPRTFALGPSFDDRRVYRCVDCAWDWIEDEGVTIITEAPALQPVCPALGTLETTTMTVTTEIIARDQQKRQNAANPFHPYEDTEAMFEDISNTLTDAGMHPTVAFFIATAAMDFADNTQNVWERYSQGELDDSTIEDALRQNGCPSCGQPL